MQGEIESYLLELSDLTSLFVQKRSKLSLGSIQYTIRLTSSAIATKTKSSILVESRPSSSQPLRVGNGERGVKCSYADTSSEKVTELAWKLNKNLMIPYNEACPAR
jgi:hypothetical protein